LTLQTILILGAVVVAAGYLLRGILGSFGQGCAPGCGGCAKPCPVKKLEELARSLPQPQTQPHSRSGGPSSSSPDSSRFVMKR